MAPSRAEALLPATKAQSGINRISTRSAKNSYAFKDEA
jgi:hypothetical protein